MTEHSLLTPMEVAARLRVTTGTLAKWRLRGAAPKFIKLGRSVRYPSDAVDQMLAEMPRRSSTSDHPTARPAA